MGVLRLAAAWRALQRAGRWLPRQVGSDTALPSSSRPYPAAGRTPAQRATRLEQVLNEYLDTLGARHHRSIAARNNLAAQYSQLGRTEAAVAEFERALADAREALGDRDPQSDVIRENLAYCYEDARRFGDAAALWEALVQQRSQNFGARAVETVNARASLAAAYGKTDQLEAAVAHAERAVEDATLLSGERLEQLRIGLTRAYRDAGQIDAAVQQLRMVLAQRQHRLGAAHADTLALGHRLGRLQLEAGRSEDAATTLRGAYKDALSASGDPEVRLLALKIRRDLARSYRSAGRDHDIAELR